jgi:hypothetical protein
VPEAKQRLGEREPGCGSIHRRWPPVCQDDRRKIVLIERFEMLQGPRVVLFCLAREKSKGDAERALARVNSNHVKKWHSVLIRLVSAIQYQDVGIVL